MPNKDIKRELTYALNSLNKVKKKLAPNEYNDIHNFILNARDAADG